MVRPPGLPMPVRDHRNHEVTISADPAVPGPGAYPVSNPRDHRLGIFGRSGRDPTSLYPGDLRTPTLRRDNLKKPAPCEHDVRGIIPGAKLRIPVSFPRASRFTRGHADANPGPGAYHRNAEDEHPEERAQKCGVSFTHARRTDSSMGDRDIPGPGTYQPILPPKRVRSATFGRSSRAPPEPPRLTPNSDAESRASARRERVAARSHSRDTTPSLRGGVAAGVSFTKAPRDPLRLASSASPGPGRYTPGFGAIDKRPRSAVLYLGA